MSHSPEHIRATTTHARRGAVKNAFRYGVDYVLIEPEEGATGPALFSRNRFNLAAVHDQDHGGPMGQGKGSAWARSVLSQNGFPEEGLHLLLLTHPRFLGYVFNPVSFWLAMRGGDLVAVIAEVSTPFGDRHSYLCHTPGRGPITKDTRITKPKALHVSPYQQIAGDYIFAFDLTPERIAIRIQHHNGPEGVVATLLGKRAPLTNAGIVGAGIRRPFGALRTIALIYWQALVLKLKGAPYRTRPAPPEREVT